MLGTDGRITSMVGHCGDVVDLYRDRAGFRFASRFYRELTDLSVSILQEKEIAVMERLELSPFTLKIAQHFSAGIEPNFVQRAIFTHI
jgi:hypothetical protein